jgi:hypothetical protein
MTPDIPEQVTKALISIDTKILTLAYKDIAQPGVQQVGKALSTVLGLGNTAMLPLKLMNEKAQMWFTAHMESYRKRLENVPPEDIVEVAPEIGVPILEKLEKTTNPKLSELYLNLLAAASVADTAALTHPRFVLLIESMAPDEAKVLDYMWKPTPRIHLPYIRVTAGEHLAEGESSDGRPIETILKNVTVLETSDYLAFPKNSRLYINNLISLGLLYAEEGRMTVNQSDYDFLEKHFQGEIQYSGGWFAREHKLPHAFITTQLGYYDLTELGLSFLQVCSPVERVRPAVTTQPVPTRHKAPKKKTPPRP